MLGPVRVDSLGFRTDLMLRFLEGGKIVDHGGFLTVCSPENPAFWWGNFLLMPESALRDDAATWMSRFTEAFPAAAHMTIGVDGTGGGAVQPAAYVAAGFRVERSTVMTAAGLREPPRRNHAALYRPLETEDDWRQAVELRVACTDEAAGAREFCERRVADERRLAEAGHGACFGAFQQGRLAAQLGLFSDGGQIARYQNVETHPSARRQGLAATLVHHAGLYGFSVLGASTLVIVADPDYTAIRIYRSVGFADTETQLSLQREPAGP
jgi:ribosomal protein S18 acetylase RimI-like enzyme